MFDWYDRKEKSLEYMGSAAFLKLDKEFLQHTDKIKFKPGVEGNHVDVDGIVYVGDRAGPQIDFINLCHELSHFVEIDDKRMKMYGWGLSLPEMYIMGQRCIEPVTMQATARELRVMAYQTNLLKYLGKKVSVRNLVTSLKWMADFCYIPLEDGLPAYVDDGDGNYKCRVEYKNLDSSRIKWAIARVKELRKKYTIDKFKSEWFRKIKLL